jgi:hypothetical protein
MDKTRIIPMGKTPKGFPYVAEKGGAMTSQGEAVIFCAENGAPLKPFFTPKHGHLCNAEHALFSPKKGMIRIYVDGKTEDLYITIDRLLFWAQNPETGEWEGKYETLADFSAEDPHPEVEDYKYLREVAAFHFPYLKDALFAASKKAGAYHCKSAYYVDITNN